MPPPKDHDKYAVYCKNVSNGLKNYYKHNPSKHIGKTPWNKGKKGLQIPWNKGVPTTETQRQKQREAMLGNIPWNRGIPCTDNTKEKIRSKAIGRKASEETKLKMSIASKGKPKSEKTKQAMRHPKTEEHRQSLRKPKSEKTKQAMRHPKTEEHRKNISIGLTGRVHSQDTLNKQRIAQRQYIEEHPEKRLEQSIRMKKRFEIDEQFRTNNILKGYDLWYGGVTYPTYPVYCEKWTPDLRERVRAFFNYVCVNCGSPQNGKKLNVHHVNYNKNTCCDNDPRLLVTLCTSCHISTNNNREHWEREYTNIINTYYGGKCFLTKEEMKQLKPSVDRFNYNETNMAYQLDLIP